MDVSIVAEVMKFRERAETKLLSAEVEQLRVEVNREKDDDHVMSMDHSLRSIWVR